MNGDNLKDNSSTLSWTLITFSPLPSFSSALIAFASDAVSLLDYLPIFSLYLRYLRVPRQSSHSPQLTSISDRRPLSISLESHHHLGDRITVSTDLVAEVPQVAQTKVRRCRSTEL